MADIDVLGVSAHLDFNDIQKSINDLIRELDKIGAKTDVLSKRMNDAMNDIARSSDDMATKSKKAMDVLSQGVAEAKLALEKYPEALRQAKNEEEATAQATARLEEQLKKLNAEFLNSNVGSEKYEKLKTSIAGVEQQINANNLVHEKQLQTIQEMEAGYSQLVSMYGVGSAAIGTNAVAHTTVAVATGTEAAAHLDNAEKIEKETEATKENTKEKQQLTAAQKEATAALQPFQKEIASINQELAKDGDIQKAIQRYDELIAKIQELYNAENAKTTNFIGEHGERRDEWNEYITSADYTEAQQKALLYSNTLNELRSAKAKLASISEEVSVAQKEENQSTQVASSSFKEQWNNVNELHDKIRELTRELQTYQEEYDKMSSKSGFDADSKKAQELLEKINSLKTQIADTKQEMSETSGVGAFFAKFKNGVTDAITGGGKFQQSLGDIKTALSGLVGPFSSATKGALEFTKALWRMAMTPLGAVITAIVLGLKAMHTWFTKSAEGQKAFAKITAFLSSLLSSLTDLVVKIGGYLYHAFADPQGALNQFGKGLIGMVVNPLKAVGNTLAGVGKIAKGVYDLIASGANVAEAKRAASEIAQGWENLKKAAGNVGDTLKSAWDTVAGGIQGAFKVGSKGIGELWSADLTKIGSDWLKSARQMSDLAGREIELQHRMVELKNEEKQLDIEIAKEREKIYTLTGKEKDAQIAKVIAMYKEKYKPQIDAQQKLADIQKERNRLHTTSLEQIAKEREMQGAVYALQAQEASSTRMLVRMKQANLKSIANADKKDAKKQQQIEEAQTNYDEVVRKNSIAYAKAVQDMEQKIADARISAMEEGAEKYLSAKNRELEKELLQIDEQRKAAIEAERARQKAEFQAQEKIIKARGGKTEQWDDSKMDNTPVEAINAKFETLRKLYIERRNASEEKANKEAIKQYLLQYGEYEDKKRIIYEQANDKICELEETLSNATTEEAKKAAEQHIEIVRKQTKEQIREIDVQYGKAKKFMVDLFEDTEQKSVGQLQKIIDKYKELLKFLKGDSSTSRDTLKALGFTDEQIDEALKNAKTRGVEFFKTISDSIKSLESEVGQKSLWQRISEKIKKARETLDSDKSTPESKGQAMIDLSDAVLEAIPAFEDLGTAIFNCFNVDDSQLKAATQSLANFIGLAKSIGQIKAGDTMNGVMGIVGFAVSSASSIINSLRSEKQLDIARATASIDRRLEVTNERLQKLNDTLKESYGVAAQDVAKETRETIQKRQELALEGLRNSSYTKDWIVNGVIINKLAQDIGNRYGLDYGLAHDIFGSKQEDFSDLLNKNSLDALIAAFKKLKEEGGELWAKLTADSSVKQYVETLIDSIEELEELEKSLKEQIVGTSFDNVFNSFMSNMYNMADGAKDVEKQIASDWQQTINKMVLNNVMGERYKEKLKAWYEKWYEAYNGDKNISESEIANLRNEYNTIVKEAADEVKALREQGLVKQTNGNDQQSTYNSLEKWSYEQADDLINRATALQIIDENQYQVLSQSLEVAYSTLSGVEGIRASVQEIASAIAVTIELQEAANGKLDKIIANTNPIGEIRDLVKKLYNER